MATFLAGVLVGVGLTIIVAVGWASCALASQIDRQIDRMEGR